MTDNYLMMVFCACLLAIAIFIRPNGRKKAKALERLQTSYFEEIFNFSSNYTFFNKKQD